MNVTLLNIRNFHSDKKDKDYTILTVLRSATQTERQRGLIGNTVAEEIFLPDSLVNKFTEKDLDKELQLQYSVIGGKAVLDNIVVK